MAKDAGDMEARLAAVEERLAALEGRPTAPVAPSRADAFWALTGLQERSGDESAVLFAGTVTVGSGEHYVWQQGARADALLAADPDDLAPALAALGHRVRLQLLQAVLAGRRTVAELEGLEALGTSGQLYHHLRQLVQAGWLHAAGRGRYAVPAERVVPLLVVLAAVAPRTHDPRSDP